VRESRPKPTQATLTPEVGGRDHVLGPRGAAVTLVEYGDFECEFCGRAYPELQRLLKQVGGKVRFIFRHFPIPEEHPHAQHAAEVAEAAAAQGKFWEMHDLLYQHQSALTDEDLLRYARELGLDVARVQRELAAHTYAPLVRQDFMGGVHSGVSGTPRFFINGRRHEEPGDVTTLAAALRRTL
jgi:protein-disulfide isomerase